MFTYQSTNKTICLILSVIAFSMLTFFHHGQLYAQGVWGTCQWVGVEKAGINSHQPERAWCPNGFFLVGFDLDGDKRYSEHDAPIIGQAYCCNLAGTSNTWSSCSWKGVERAGISSHQPGTAWSQPGSFLVAFDLDGDRSLDPHDAPVIGQAMSCNLAGALSNQWGSCEWVGVEKAGINSHQPERAWCPNGSFLVAFDLDGDRRLDPHDAPVVGQALCCNLEHSLAQDKPDLQIIKVDIKKNIGQDPYFTHQLVTTVKNNGSVTASGFNGGCTYHCPTGSIKSAGIMIVSGGYILGKSEFTYIQPFRFACDNVPSSIKLDCMIDSDNSILESNETNNSYSSNIAVP